MKTQINKEVIICDHCKKKEERSTAKAVGSKNKFSGFIHVEFEPEEIKAERFYGMHVLGDSCQAAEKEGVITDFDFCSKECMIAHFEG